MNKTTAAARIAARTIHPLQSNMPAERAAQAAQDHILSVPALREITPADILAAHKAAARAVVLDSPIPSPAECDAQMSELHAGDDTAKMVLSTARRERVKCFLQAAAVALIDAQIEMLMDTPHSSEWELSARLSPELLTLYRATYAAEHATVDAQNLL